MEADSRSLDLCQCENEYLLYYNNSEMVYICIERNLYIIDTLIVGCFVFNFKDKSDDIQYRILLTITNIELNLQIQSIM